MTEEKEKHFVLGNKFYIQGEIGEELCAKITAPLIALIETKEKEKAPTSIDIYLCSPGGDVYPALDLVAQIERAKKIGIEVRTIVTGHVASAASLIAVTGHKRLVSKRASHLIHYARMWQYSNNPEMLDREYEFGKWLQQTLVDIYKEYTKLEDVETKIKTDNYRINGAEDLIRLGLADEII